MEMFRSMLGIGKGRLKRKLSREKQRKYDKSLKAIGVFGE